jgi:hypothetical protein
MTQTLFTRNYFDPTSNQTQRHSERRSFAAWFLWEKMGHHLTKKIFSGYGINLIGFPKWR